MMIPILKLKYWANFIDHRHVVFFDPIVTPFGPQTTEEILISNFSEITDFCTIVNYVHSVVVRRLFRNGNSLLKIVQILILW